MEELLKEGIKFEEGVSDSTPVTKFGQGALKTLIGDKRAFKVLQSMSMSVIPKVCGSFEEGIQDGK